MGKGRNPRTRRIEVDLVGGITCVAYGIVIPCCFAVLFAKQHVIMQPLGRSLSASEDLFNIFGVPGRGRRGFACHRQAEQDLLHRMRRWQSGKGASAS